MFFFLIITITLSLSLTYYKPEINISNYSILIFSTSKLTNLSPVRVSPLHMLSAIKCSSKLMRVICEMNFTLSMKSINNKRSRGKTKRILSALLPIPLSHHTPLSFGLRFATLEIFALFRSALLCSVLLCNACLWLLIINLSMKLMAIFPGDVYAS